ncbi:phospholipase D-like domain-containing protein [Halobacillus halophilus]|uniref:phospholipase D-like domain-containing protein n=1 Tax=Halobacillus halophilus TaxID=1570 RepID=UPI001CD1E647|nr:phospholipase D-like domain-containing protein [Halobacillus halophilus]MCA1011757.1 phospholipase D-like domain-containing protein [Halobacillus halophilus]
MPSVYGNIAHFINVVLSEYSESYLNKIIKEIESSEEKNLMLFSRRLDLPFQLEYLFHEVIKEASNQDISLQELLLLLKSSKASAEYQIKYQPSIHPVWTGPDVEGYISNKTYDTVKVMFQHAKDEIFIVGYAFSFYDSSVLDLLKEIENAAYRGCRINIIVNRNEKNINQIFDNWSIDRHKLNVYKWYSEVTDYTSLHAKLIMVDQLRLLITSANFSLHGFHKNVETGVVIESHSSIRDIWLQYQSLLRNGHVVKVF